MRLDAIQLRVFIEGVLVPKANNVTVQTFANETARASFTVPPVPGFEAEELVRARVHIFWSDVEIRAAHDVDDWPVLFEGEIVADAFGKTPQSRQQTFHCSGYHTYWEQVLLYYYDLSSSGYDAPLWADTLSVALGNENFNLDLGTAGVNLERRIVGEMQDELSKNGDNQYHSIVRGLFGKTLDTNHYFRESNSALALASRFATPRDKNLDVLMSRDMLLEALNKDVLARKGESTMMDVLHSVLRLFRYQILCNAQPAILDPKERRRKTAADIEAANDRAITRWRQFLESLDPAVVASNVTSVGLSETQVEKYVSEISGAGSADNESFIQGLAEAVLVDLGYRDNSDPEYVEGLDAIAFTAREVAEALTVANEPAADSDGALDRNKEFGDLLSQFMILPDTRFALPPTCNVIFPGHQTSLSMNRDLLKRPTRGIAFSFSEANVPFRVYIAPDGISQARVPPRSVPSISARGFAKPISAPHRITSAFGYRSRPQKLPGDKGKRIKHGKRKFHKGIDIGGKIGVNRGAAFLGTPVHVLDDGVVIRSGYENPNNIRQGFGLRVTVRHANGMVSIYGHLSAKYVLKGDTVARGDVIGTVGNTGSSNGPHLHFEVRIDGEAEDPEPLIAGLSQDQTTNSQQVPEPTGAEEATAAEVPEKKITDAAAAATSDEKFSDFKYLTPEEEIKGIVPFFDRDVVRAHTFVAAGGNEGGSDEYLRQMLKTELFQRRYETSNLDTLTMPLNPNVVAGFPALVLDPSRSIIGRVTSVVHTITVGGGQGSATTSVSVDAPRFWDEGDPYYWEGGKEDTAPTKFGKETRDLPSNLVGPTYYLTSLLGTNSTDVDHWWLPATTNPRHNRRPVDDLYEQLLGPGVKGIPYQYATRTTNQATTVAYNKAIDSRRESVNENNPFAPKPHNGNTLIGRYYALADRDPALAEEYVRSFTRRHGVSERALMSRVLGAETADAGFSYTAPAFRPLYQATVRRMIAIMTEERTFRG